ncbi:heavy-metal-associated domain-containing protein [Oceanobacillus senegalensis]|uniref:heavy-metal-associated domain-containing protein n=1 Tax=Oceanobacillus senegalensis TaxID=1936063 RepID=UPI000A3125E2|nr:heavy metal-associated domain-containing protein [Oceanobacillus senegalensis]
MNETVYLNVVGMHCPDCPKKVERSILKLDGVSKVEIDYETEHGFVTFNKKLTSFTEIINRIRKMGFEAKNIQHKSLELNNMNK